MSLERAQHHKVESSTATCSLDGIALFLSSLAYIHSTRPLHSCFMLSTHFSDYLEHDVLRSLHSSFTFKQMNVILDTENGNLVTPLFQVVDGVCQDSLGIRCARAFGMPQEITERAQQVMKNTEIEHRFMIVFTRTRKCRLFRT